MKLLEINLKYSLIYLFRGKQICPLPYLVNFLYLIRFGSTLSGPRRRILSAS